MHISALALALGVDEVFDNKYRAGHKSKTIHGQGLWCFWLINSLACAHLSRSSDSLTLIFWGPAQDPTKSTQNSSDSGAASYEGNIRDKGIRLGCIVKDCTRACIPGILDHLLLPRLGESQSKLSKPARKSLLVSTKHELIAANGLGPMRSAGGNFSRSLPSWSCLDQIWTVKKNQLACKSQQLIWQCSENFELGKRDLILFAAACHLLSFRTLTPACRLFFVKLSLQESSSIVRSVACNDASKSSKQSAEVRSTQLAKLDRSKDRKR